MLRLYNTLTQQLDTFTPNDPPRVTMYVCGITPYDTTHLGHAFTYLTFDVLIKYLTFLGYHVDYTQNVTDINDRNNDILKRAKDQHTTWQELSTYWTRRFLTDMGQLNWTKPTTYLYASTQIPAMVKIIQEILANGHAYAANGGVYLDVTTYPGYGKLSGLNEQEMLEKAKDFEEDIANPDKKHPLDITLWRPTTPTQDPTIPSFESPFGKGRPGWHIECSAMAMASLGQQIDIHGGGIDLIFPHHESEIAQSETASGKSPFAKYWMHVNLVQKDHEKMSKSLGNLVLVSDLLTTFSPNAIRWYLLSHHYQSSWNYEESELQQAEKMAEKLQDILRDDKKTYYESVILAQKSASGGKAGIQEEWIPDQVRNDKDIQSNSTSHPLLVSFQEAMDDNLNTPKALQLLSAIDTKEHTTEELHALARIATTLGFQL